MLFSWGHSIFFLQNRSNLQGNSPSQRFRNFMTLCEHQFCIGSIYINLIKISTFVRKVCLYHWYIQILQNLSLKFYHVFEQCPLDYLANFDVFSFPDLWYMTIFFRKNLKCRAKLMAIKTDVKMIKRVSPQNITKL